MHVTVSHSECIPLAGAVLGLEREGEEMLKTRTENVLRKEEYGKEEEKGRRAGNTEGIKRLKVAAENQQWWERFLRTVIREQQMKWYYLYPNTCSHICQN